MPASAAGLPSSTRKTTTSSPTSRSSSPTSCAAPPSALALRSAACSAGITPKCDCRSRPSISPITARSSSCVRAAAARGRSSSRSPGQSTPLNVVSKCVRWMTAQAESNVAAASPGGTPGCAGRRAAQAATARPSTSVASAGIGGAGRRAAADFERRGARAIGGPLPGDHSGTAAPGRAGSGYRQENFVKMAREGNPVCAGAGAGARGHRV